MKRIVSTILLAVVLLGLLPISSFAADIPRTAAVKQEGDLYVSDTFNLPNTKAHPGIGSWADAGHDWDPLFRKDGQPLQCMFVYNPSDSTVKIGWYDTNGTLSFDKISGHAPGWDWASLGSTMGDWYTYMDGVSDPGYNEGRKVLESFIHFMSLLHAKLCPEHAGKDIRNTISTGACSWYDSISYYSAYDKAGSGENYHVSVQRSSVYSAVRLLLTAWGGSTASDNYASTWTHLQVSESGTVTKLLSAQFLKDVVGYSIADGASDNYFINHLQSAVEFLYGKTDEQLQEDALVDASESLGSYPSAGTFFDRAVWSARAYLVEVAAGRTPDLTQYITKEAAEATNATEYGDPHGTLKRAYVLSLFNLRESQASGISGILTGPATSDMPLDAVTAAYALRMYNSLDASGALDDKYKSMESWVYKLQATMGLASGLLAANSSDESGTAVTQDEINNFISAAYGQSLATTRNLMFGRVNYPRSNHLGVEVNASYYYYLVVCYQEFGVYATTLINSLGPSIAEGLDTFSAHKNDIKMLKALYDGLSWANDDALWEFWNNENKDLTYESSNYRTLKSVYDYLLSINAFEAVVDYNAEDVSSQFRYFFGESDSSGFQLSDYIQTGIVASASFLPMRTNLYDPYTFSGIVDTSWLVNFHSKFGYNRKALYIDTNVDAAVNFQRTGTRGALRVCTLEDLLYADKDIVLYLDDNLYNVKTLAELSDKAFNRLDNVDQESSSRAWWQKIGDAIVGIWDVSMENIAKTAEVTTYSQKVQSAYARETTLNGQWHTFFLHNGDIEPDAASGEVIAETSTSAYYLTPDDLWDDEKGQLYAQDEENNGGHEASTYTPLTAFAVISSIYSEPSLFASLNTVLNKNTPVFISSPSVPYLEDASTVERNIIYNYLLLKNLDSQMSVDYATNLDMTSPVYMDIYGNIVTESGLVVVPAAANASLWTGSYMPYNAAMFSTYGDDFLLEYSEDASGLNSVLSEIFTQVGDCWQLTGAKVNGGTIDLSKLSTADKDSLAAISDVFAYDLSTGVIYQQAFWQMLITEVLRGAPIEHIDKDFEGLNLSHRVTKNGLIVAEKLEFLVDALSSKGTNTTLSIPNPAYMDGIEYVVFFAFKILILAILVIWMITIYVDAVGGGVNFRTGAKCIGAVVLVLSLIVGVPAAFEVSYYQSNKILLQDETEYLMMLNLEKSESGQEIGITDIHEPDTNTTLYLKLADVEIPWYDLLPKIITSSSVNNLEALYAEYEGQHPIASAKDVTVINDAVYVSTDQLFGSSTITFSPTIKKLYQQTTGDTPASYYTPYYYFLEQIINKANQWSDDNDYFAYTTKVQRGGKLKTLGYVQPYFTSEYFMQEGMDYFGLYTLYDVTAPMQYSDEKIYSDATMAATRASQWCNTGISEDAKIQRIEALNRFTRQWVAEHRDLLGKVTDETFLKCMALACAMEHNRLFNTLRADNLEIYELSNEDLMRLSIADHDTVMKSSTMSYARFVFTVGGTPAVYAAALLTLVNFISSWVKPIATLLVFCITCICIFVFKLILRKNNNSIYGYICTILLMCSVNVLGSVFLKLSMYIPSTGMSPTVCILIQILAQCVYIYMLLWIIKTAIKDWRNMGFERYNASFNKLTKRQQYSVEVDTPKQKDGWDYYNALVERQRRRHRSL